jgi:hypothetical protein
MRVLWLIVGLAWLALAGCVKPPPTFEEAHADFTAKINKAIKDPARARRVSEVAEQLLDQQQAMAAELKSTVDQLATLNADYNASNDQYMAVYNDYQGRRKAAQMTFEHGIFALRKEVSAEEWKEITK